MKKLCIILAIICFSSFIISGTMFSLAIGNANFNLFSKDIDEEYYSNFNGENIKVSGAFNNLILAPYDGSDVKVTINGNYKSFMKSDLTLDMNKTINNLNIELKSNKYLGFIALGPFIYNIDLTIYIPNSYHGNLTIDVVCKSINVTDLDLSNININCASGEINVSNANTQKINIDGVSGKISLDNITGDLKLNTLSGDIFIKYLEYNNKINIDSVSGNITIILPRGYNKSSLNIDSLSGKIEINEF